MIFNDYDRPEMTRDDWGKPRMTEMTGNERDDWDRLGMTGIDWG